MLFSAAISSRLHGELCEYLLRADGQEDVCFAVYHPSSGTTRTSGVLHHAVWPRPGERSVHGNASFSDEYFLRASAEANAVGGGVALLHSHPGGTGWQGMSADDIHAEREHAAQAMGLTDLPLLGLTLASDRAWSCRAWPRTRRSHYQRTDAECVRVVGDRLQVTHNPASRPAKAFDESHVRTVSAWGETVQSDISRLRVGVVGLGSVGALVAEALMRMGIGELVLIDFDSVKWKNLDRLAHATRLDALLLRSKAETVAAALRRGAAHGVQVRVVEASVVEEAGFRRALDCDVLFSCVDGHWPRAVLNTIAYAHLIPVIDGGIKVIASGVGMQGAHWRAQVAAPGRMCLECGEGFDPGLIALEQCGLAEDPAYIAGLVDAHELVSGENVFPFSAGCASLELLQAVLMLVGPAGVSDIGLQVYQLTQGQVDKDVGDCAPGCAYSEPWTALGDNCPTYLLGQDLRAECERAERSSHQRRLGIRAGRAFQRLSDWLLMRAERALRSPRDHTSDG